MKKVALVLMTVIICAIFNSSCKKNAPNTAKSPVGKWQWYATYLDNALSDSNPLTPQNTPNVELLTFNEDYTFKHILNNKTIDSGTYSYGHGIYVSSFNVKYEYDSILYYHNSIPIIGGVDYYTLNSDTLGINPGLAGQYSCYSVPYGLSKWWVKQ